MKMSRELLNSQSRKLVLNVLEYFQNEKETSHEDISVIDCAAEALKLSPKTILRIREGVDEIIVSNEGIIKQGKKRPAQQKNSRNTKSAAGTKKAVLSADSVSMSIKEEIDETPLYEHDVSTKIVTPTNLKIKTETEATTLDVAHIKVKEEIPLESEVNVRDNSLVVKPEFVSVPEYSIKTEEKIKEDQMDTESIPQVKQEQHFEIEAKIKEEVLECEL